MRTNNYFELRNREMGFYTELRTAIILARINVDRTALRLFRERANAIRRVLASPAIGEGGKKKRERKKTKQNRIVLHRYIIPHDSYHNSFQIEKDRLEWATFLSVVLIRSNAFFLCIFELCQVYIYMVILSITFSYTHV